MAAVLSLYRQFVAFAAGRIGESLALIVSRLALAQVFWASGRTKVEDGTWLQVSDTTRYLFAEEYAGVPLPPDLAAHMALYAETFLPVLLVFGLFTRLSALGLLGMTAMIQIFVYPEAWTVHILWAGLALVLVSRGSGLFGLDPLARRTCQTVCDSSCPSRRS
ncbi:MAG: DoxX family protein [Novosphingobium sp.]